MDTSRRRGTTLIELLVVLIIAGILFGSVSYISSRTLDETTGKPAEQTLGEVDRQARLLARQAEAVDLAPYVLQAASSVPDVGGRMAVLGTQVAFEAAGVCGLLDVVRASRPNGIEIATDRCDTVLNDAAAVDPR